MRLIAALSVLFALGLTACERPLVDPLERDVEVVGLDLDQVQISPLLVLALRVEGAESLTLNGEPVDYDSTRGLFTRTLTLTRGVNRLGVVASDPGGVVAQDTLVAVYLPLEAQPQAAVGLATPRTESATVALPDGRAFVTGGVGLGTTALATTTVLTPSGGRFTATDAPLLTGRAGHTASLLPDGGVLILGGARSEAPARSADFVSTVEWIPPGATESQPVALPAGGAIRTGHTTRVLVSDAGVSVYVYGGFVPGASGVTTSRTVDVFDWDAATATLTRRSPEGGAGQFPALADHLQIPLADSPLAATSRTVDVVFGGDTSLLFDFARPGANYPFDLSSRGAESLSTPRTEAVGVQLVGGLVLVAGGRDADGRVLNSFELYAADVDQTFRFSDAVRLAVARAGASATRLPDGRILIVGGRTESNALSGAVEVFAE